MRTTEAEQINQTLSTLVSAVTNSEQAAFQVLQEFAWHRAALLPTLTLEFGILPSGSSSVDIQSQTKDVEVIEGILVALDGEPAATTSLAVTLDSVVIPVVFGTSDNPIAILSPLGIPVASRRRTVAWTSSAPADNATVVLWGKVSPARTRSVS